MTIIVPSPQLLIHAKNKDYVTQISHREHKLRNLNSNINSLLDDCTINLSLMCFNGVNPAIHQARVYSSVIISDFIELNNPKNPLFYGTLAASANDYENAIYWYEIAAKRKSITAMNAIGHIYLKIYQKIRHFDKYQEFPIENDNEKETEKVIEKEPNWYNFSSYKTNIFYKKDPSKEALKWFYRAYKLGSIQSLQYIARVYELIDKKAEALHFYRKHYKITMERGILESRTSFVTESESISDFTGYFKSNLNFSGSLFSKYKISKLLDLLGYTNSEFVWLVSCAEQNGHLKSVQRILKLRENEKKVKNKLCDDICSAFCNKLNNKIDNSENKRSFINTTEKNIRLAKIISMLKYKLNTNKNLSKDDPNLNRNNIIEEIDNINNDSNINDNNVNDSNINDNNTSDNKNNENNNSNANDDFNDNNNNIEKECNLVDSNNNSDIKINDNNNNINTINKSDYTSNDNNCDNIFNVDINFTENDSYRVIKLKVGSNEQDVTVLDDANQSSVSISDGACNFGSESLNCNGTVVDFSGWNSLYETFSSQVITNGTNSFMQPLILKPLEVPSFKGTFLEFCSIDSLTIRKECIPQYESSIQIGLPEFNFADSDNCLILNDDSESPFSTEMFFDTIPKESDEDQDDDSLFSMVNVVFPIDSLSSSQLHSPLASSYSKKLKKKVKFYSSVRPAFFPSASKTQYLHLAFKFASPSFFKRNLQMTSIFLQKMSLLHPKGIAESSLFRNKCKSIKSKHLIQCGFVSILCHDSKFALDLFMKAAKMGDETGSLMTGLLMFHGLNVTRQVKNGCYYLSQCSTDPIALLHLSLACKDEIYELRAREQLGIYSSSFQYDTSKLPHSIKEINSTISFHLLDPKKQDLNQQQNTSNNHDDEENNKNVPRYKMYEWVGDLFSNLVKLPLNVGIALMFYGIAMKKAEDDGDDISSIIKKISNVSREPAIVD